MKTSLLPRCTTLAAITALGFFHALAVATSARADDARSRHVTSPSAPADPDGIAITTYLWRGNGNNDNFSTPNNWSQGIAPQNDGSVLLQFAGNTRLTPVAEVPYSLYAVAFNSGASAFTLSGGALTLFGGGIANHSANPQTINNAVTLQFGTQGVSFGSGAGALNFGNDLIIGASGNTATLNFSAGTVNLTSGGNAMSLGIGTGTGTLNLSGTASLSAYTIYVGNTGTGSVTQSGGSVNTHTKNLYVSFKTASDHGTYTLSGADSTLTTANTLIGYRGTGAFTQSDGTHTTGSLIFGSSFTSSASNASYNLDGGTLLTGSVGSTSPSNLTTSVFSFNGGTLKAMTNSTTFFEGLLTANVRNNGAFIDTNGFNVTVAQPLLHASTGGNTYDGGVAKFGAGTLTLKGANTYNGETYIQAGTLAVGTSGALGATFDIEIASGATLDFLALSGSAYTVAADCSVTNHGTIAGNLTLASGAFYDGAGTVNGALTVNSGANVTIYDGTLTVNGTLTNNGYMLFARGSALVVSGSGSTFVNNGTLDVINGSFTVPAGGFTNSGVVLDSRVVKAKAVTRTAGTVSVFIDSYDRHLYKLQRNDSLNTGTFADITGVVTQVGHTGTTLAFTDNNPAPDKGFYRVVVSD